ncbi:hypothetical protein [Nocardia africana]|uniref:DUF3298 domain-containing protein n=1 Tax=Nocardia africana TaxID=134964 RepID=A0A378WMS4_9NOCA|nr:hypothetical protein [Nocardia africana]MCC3315964.1 hypothetical protein [Nocardia africana]SUA41704.1 Uncharacterised protein [Nocardia africana]
MKNAMWVAIWVGVAALSACGTDDAGHGRVAASSEPVAQQVTESPGQQAGCPQSPAPSAGPYTATTVAVREQTATLTTDVTLPQLEGGDEAVRERFNAAMRASLADLRGGAADGALHDARLRCGETSRVTRIGAHVVAGVLITDHTWEGGPHPVNQIGTVVLDTGTAQPVLLPTALRDPDRSWNALATTAQSLVPPDGPTLFTHAPGSDDFANWVPSPEGLTVYFPVAHARGDYYPVQLPWNRIRDLFDPAALTTLSS